MWDRLEEWPCPLCPHLTPATGAQTRLGCEDWEALPSWAIPQCLCVSPEEPRLVEGSGHGSLKDLTSWLAWIWWRYCRRRSGGLEPRAACSVTSLWGDTRGTRLERVLLPCVPR